LVFERTKTETLKPCLFVRLLPFWPCFLLSIRPPPPTETFWSHRLGGNQISRNLEFTPLLPHASGLLLFGSYTNHWWKIMRLRGKRLMKLSSWACKTGRSLRLSSAIKPTNS
jgi:hypothetical protein